MIDVALVGLGWWGRTLQRELEWVRMAPRARHAKSKARLAGYEQLQHQLLATEEGLHDGLFGEHPVKTALLNIIDFTVERGF